MKQGRAHSLFEEQVKNENINTFYSVPEARMMSELPPSFNPFDQNPFSNSIISKV